MALKGGGFIECRTEEYRLLHGGPRRVGDLDEIMVLPSWRRVRVMLREAEDGTLWLVEFPKRL